MTERWRVVRLRAVVTQAQTGPFGSQLHADEYIENGIPLINPSNIKDGKVIADRRVTVDDKTAKRLSRHRLAVGDLIFARRGEIGRSAVVMTDSVGWLCGTGSLRVTLRQDVLDSRFVGYVLRSEPTREYFVAQAVGSTMENLNTDIVLGLPIPYPPIDEQRRIADFLDIETERIAKVRVLRERQRRLLLDRFLQLLADGYEQLASRNGTVRLRHVIRRIEQGWSPECENRLAEAGEWGVIKAGCVNGGIFRPEEHKALPAGVKPRAQYLLRKGDLLMSRASGSPDLIGSAAIVDQIERKLLLCDKVYRLIVNRQQMTPEFVAVMLKSPQVRAIIKLGISGAGGLANNIPTPVVRDLPVPKVSLKEQGQFLSEVARLSTATSQVVSALERQLALLAERQASLITSAVAGTIDVTTARGVGA